MRKNPETARLPAEHVVKDIRRATRKLHSAGDFAAVDDADATDAAEDDAATGDETDDGADDSEDDGGDDGGDDSGGGDE